MLGKTDLVYLENMHITKDIKDVIHHGHSRYQSLLPLPAVVDFFQAGGLFSSENAKCWPVLDNLSCLLRIYALYTGLLQS